MHANFKSMLSCHRWKENLDTWLQWNHFWLEQHLFICSGQTDSIKSSSGNKAWQGEKWIMKGHLAFYEASLAALRDKAATVSRTTVPPSIQITGVTESTLDRCMCFALFTPCFNSQTRRGEHKGFEMWNTSTLMYHESHHLVKTKPDWPHGRLISFQTVSLARG